MISGLEPEISEVSEARKPENTAELLLSLDGEHSKWSSVLAPEEWAIWKLTRVFGFTPTNLISAVIEYGFQETLKKIQPSALYDPVKREYIADPPYWAHVGTLGTDIRVETIALHTRSILAKDVRRETFQFNGYKISKRRGRLINSPAEIYVVGLDPMFQTLGYTVSIDSLGESIERIAERIGEIGNLAAEKLQQRARVYLRRWMPKLTEEEEIIKRDAQRAAIESENIQSISNVQERTVMRVWIELVGEKSCRAISEQIGFSKSKVAGIVKEFLKKCADKQKSHPNRDFEVFTVRVVENRDARDVGISLAILSEVGMRVRDASHGRSFDAYDLIWYKDK